MKVIVLIIFLIVLFTPMASLFAASECDQFLYEYREGSRTGNCNPGATKVDGQCLCEQVTDGDPPVRFQCTKKDGVIGCYEPGFVPCGSPGQPSCELCHVFVLIKNFFDILIDYAALIAALFIAGGGIAYILSAGNEEKAATAKKIMTSAIYGLLIVFSAWIIINTIMVMLGYQNLGLFTTDSETGKFYWYKLKITGCPL